MLFGPAGNSDRFYEEGNKSTLQAFGWLENMGLTAFEYPFGRGVGISQETAEKIAAKAREHRIAVSAHAPYFINLANPDPEKRENSFRYILEAARAVTWLGGDRVVVHVGAAMKLERAEALKNCAEGLREAYRRLEDAGLSRVHICPETMGKYSQIGDLRETVDFCLLDERLIPCVDFAHLHALTGGGLRDSEDFVRVLDTVEETLGLDRARKMHMHFSTIEYTPAGEKMHRTFAEEKYGPRFEFLAPLLKQRCYCGTVICECRGTQADDARTMQMLWQNA
ncbi:MAG: TIM barrel protein [Clostridia bacterium]|nr:TIM barrel protein [Clostridia bacterium]